MNVFRGDTRVLAIFLALIAIGVVISEPAKKPKGRSTSTTTNSSATNNTSSWQSGDYYIVAQILGIHVAYSIKYHNLQVNPNSPVAILASHIYVHNEGNLVYFWNKDCGILEVLLTQQLSETLYNQLSGLDSEETFNEVVGINDIPMSNATVQFANNLLTNLEILIEQRDSYLINFNGLILYNEIFDKYGIDYNIFTSPLGDLLLDKYVQELLQELDFKSTLISNLRTTIPNSSTDINLRYIFGALNLLDTVPNAIYSLYIAAGISTYNTDYKQLAYMALTVAGLRSSIGEILPYIFFYNNYMHDYTIMYY
ncbi:hypothetical protein DMENIID0001_030660 [Sergentomyia squamirostris]